MITENHSNSLSFNIYLAQLIICIGLRFEPEESMCYEIEIKLLNHNFQSILFIMRKFHNQRTIIPCPTNHLKLQGVPQKIDNLTIFVCFFSFTIMNFGSV